MHAPLSALVKHATPYRSNPAGVEYCFEVAPRIALGTNFHRASITAMNFCVSPKVRSRPSRLLATPLNYAYEPTRFY